MPSPSGRWKLLSLLALLACCLTSVPERAHGDAADDALDVSLPLRGAPLGTRMQILEDPDGTLGIADVLRPDRAAQFTRATTVAPNYGFSDAAYWVRIEVRNPTPERQHWLLELSAPLLDHVTLFVPRNDSVVAAAGSHASDFDPRITGDQLPFAERDLLFRNFVFSLEEPENSLRTYYMRVQSEGTVSLPVVAWSMREFLGHQYVDWAALCIFYGVIAVMACYSACVYVFAREREYLTYLAYVSCVGITQFTIAGHTFQFLLPDSPWLVHRLMPASVAATLTFASLIVRAYLPRGHLFRRLGALVVAYCGALAVLSFVLPYKTALRLMNVTVMVLMVLAILYGFELLRVEGKRARLFVFSWGSAIIGALLAALHDRGIGPSLFLNDWSMQFGWAVQLVLLSSALADKLDTARSELSAVHERLSRKLVELSVGLEKSERANREAERATQLKDEFLATMSHEFRTPLNPIINIPVEMRREFVPMRAASCTHCHTHFELDEEDALNESARCLECGRVGTLVPESAIRYVGDATRTRRYLTKIERSGAALLHVVNGILDFSKLEAGHVELNRERFEVSALVSQLAQQYAGSARAKDIGITCMLRPTQHEVVADAQRVRQVLAILLDNAIKYSARGGYVSVRAELVAGVYTLSVSDQGIGIAAGDHERIFASFEQVYSGHTRRYGGTGLGLSIARTLARMHGGDLTVTSAPGEGSTFTFTLPAAQVREVRA